jgi:xanthine/CO dehydrogenase XdhC/CoxF family maturation factor
MVARIDPFSTSDFISRCRAAQRRGALATVIASDAPGAPVGARLAVHPGGYVETDLGDGALAIRIAGDARAVIASGRSGTRTYRRGRGGSIEVQIDAVVPPPRLFVFGNGELAEKVVAAGVAGGWEIAAAGGATIGDLAAVIDGSDRAAAIVVAYGDAHDRLILDQLLATRIRYIGVAGGRDRVEPLIAYACAGGPDSRVHAPIHAELAIESPRAIASALVAEAHAVLSGEVPLRPTLRRLALVS